MVTEKVSLTSRGRSLQGWLCLPAAAGPFPLLLIGPGVEGYLGDFPELSAHLTGQSIAVFGLDWRWPGDGATFEKHREQWLSELQAATDFLGNDSRIHPFKICALGLSSGADSIFDAALADHRLRALVVLEATVQGAFSSTFHLVRQLYAGRFRNRFSGVKRISTPTLIITGEEDHLNFPESIWSLFEKLQCEKAFHIVPQDRYGGSVSYNRTIIFRFIVNWILTHTGKERDLILIEGKASARLTRQEKESLLLPFVRKYGTQSLSYATLQAGMNYYVTPKGFIAYINVVHPVFGPRGRAIVLGDPVCAREEMPEMIRSFLRWNPRACFMIISEECAALLRSKGFKANCLGPEPELSIQTYNTEGDWKEFDLIKRARNEAKRRGVTIREVPLETIPPVQLQDASSTWMESKILNTREIWIFARRPVFATEPDVRKFLAFDRDGKVVGFAFYDPMYRDGKIVGYAANTVRCDEIHFGKLATAIHMEAINAFRGEGLEVFNLCLAPFVKLNKGKFNDDAFSQRYFELCERFGNDIYNFRGLAFHKSKYRGTEKFIYFATNNPLPANDVYLAYLSAGITTSYFKALFDLLKGVVKGIGQVRKNRAHEASSQAGLSAT